MTEEKITVKRQPFLGRLEEQERFRDVLRTVNPERNLISKVYICDAQNFYNWTAMVSKAPTPPLGVRHLVKFIESESKFRDVMKLRW